MKTILIILAIIGLLKLVSLFIMVYIEIKFKLKPDGYIELEKTYGVFKTEYFYIIPTIAFNKCGKYFEVSFRWLIFDYYSAYKLKYEEDE